MNAKTPLVCDFCKADCSGSFERTRLVEVDKRHPAASKLAGEGVRCEPPCEPALAAANELLADLEAGA